MSASNLSYIAHKLPLLLVIRARFYLFVTYIPQPVFVLFSFHFLIIPYTFALFSNFSQYTVLNTLIVPFSH